MWRYGLIVAALACRAALAEPLVFDGHGGPIMDVAVGPDGAVLTASFDNSVGFWRGDGAPVWLEGHGAAVNSAVFLGGGLAASGSDDFAIEIWDLQAGVSVRRLEGHRGKVMSLAASGEGRLASASWDGTAAIWDIARGARVAELVGHKGNVNGVVFLEHGGVLTASSDGTIREWGADGAPRRVVVRHGFGVNTLVLNEAQGWLAYGAVDGGTRVVDLASGAVLADLTLERRPVLAMAAAPGMEQIAVGDGQGYIMVVETADWSISRDFRAAKNGPIWALAYTADGLSVIAGGIDDRAYLFPVAGEIEVQMSQGKQDFQRAPETMSNGERQFKRKCSVCHTLTGPGGRRAGPSLMGIFGRQAGQLEGYSFSQAMAGSDLVWSEETIDLLFDLGPDNYVPGSKMPMQRITSAQDRRDLVEFLRETTGE